MWLSFPEVVNKMTKDRNSKRYFYLNITKQIYIKNQKRKNLYKYVAKIKSLVRAIFKLTRYC